MVMAGGEFISDNHMRGAGKQPLVKLTASVYGKGTDREPKVKISDISI